MKKWFQYVGVFGKNKGYLLVLALTALCAYGFKVLHPTIGIDDTPYAYYFEEGLAAIVGRWVLFLLNKVVEIADFAPFLTDFVAVLLLMAAVTVWCGLFYSIFEDGAAGKKPPMYGYVFFAAIFLSCPLISEVFTYYLHNGIAIGYLCCGVSLCCFREGLLRLESMRFAESKQGTKGKRGIAGAGKSFLASALGLLVALGCYESFMIVWLSGIFLLLLTERFAGVPRRVFRALCVAAVVAVCGFVLRSVMIGLVTKVFGLEYLQDEAVTRSIMEMAAWMFEPGAKSEFAMVLKRIFVMYGVFAYAYYPIRIFLFASAVIGAFSIWRAIRRKDAWAFLLMVGSFVVSFLLVIIEGKATLYRSAQFLPVICGYGALLAVYAVENVRAFIKERLCGRAAADNAVEAEKGSVGNKRKLPERLSLAMSGLLILMLSSILWNQCADMNKWFYMDYNKYQSARETCNQVMYELESNFDISKPVVFTGTYDIPQSIIQDAYVAYGSETYFKMKRITDKIDEHLLEKFNRSYGVWVAQTPSLSVLDWGRYAFGNDEELVKFFAMHGHEIKPLLDTELYPVAEEYALNLPEFPQEGSIVDMGDYIIVNW